MLTELYCPRTRGRRHRNGGGPVLDTGFPRADAENEFLRARRRHVLAMLAHRLRRQPPAATACCGSTRSPARSAGVTIRLDTIARPGDSRRDFDPPFPPTSRPGQERL